MRQLEKFGGPNIYDPANKRLDEREGARGKSKSQGEGLALLAAAGAILEGNTLARGAAKAFPVFAKEMGEVQRADIAEQRSIESMRFSLADAQRKERMGDVRGAQAARENARKDKADAARFELQKANALATLDAKALQATRTNAKGAGAGLKYQEQILQNNVDYFRSTLKPKPGETPEAFDARVRKMASDETATRLKTSFSTSISDIPAGGPKDVNAKDALTTRRNAGIAADLRVWEGGSEARRAKIDGTIDEVRAAKKEALRRDALRGIYDNDDNDTAAKPKNTGKAPPPPPGFNPDKR
jgi:hypothetical protein